MPTEIALAALMKALVAKLTAANVGGVYWDIAPPGTAYPYVVVSSVSGGNDRGVGTSQRFLMQVKVLSDSRAESLAGLATVKNTLNDQGEQETTSGFLNAGSEWTVTTISDVGDISLTEMVEDVQPVFHNGVEYEIIMGLR